MLVAAVLLLADTPMRLPGRGVRSAVLLLLLAAVAFVPLPYNAIATLLLIGTAASVAPIASRWLPRLARGAIAAGSMLLCQALVLETYTSITARAHELPRLYAELIAALARLLGADIAVDSGTFVLRNAQTTIRVAATWELALDPGTVCFVAGGLVLLALLAQRRPAASRRPLLRSVLALVIVCAAWAPWRALLLMAVVLQQQLRATIITYPNVGETLISTWVHIALILVLAVLAGAIVPRPASCSSASRVRPARRPRHELTAWRQWGAVCSCLVAVATLTCLYFWAPVGQRKAGRIKVVERHSTWEPTTNAYRTQQYGEPGSYNYGAIYEYCGQFYAMSRLLKSDPIDDTTLSQCDVLVIKTPTSRYEVEEVQAVVRFVQQGGSLLMIGDHTNVFNMNTYLNDISRNFGFTFRHDLLFRIGDPYRQFYEPPKISHPILQHVPPMNFAVSCSIDPGANRGSMVIRNVGLYNLPPAYHESNYHPQAEYRPHMQYGAWCQLWTTTSGRGRVAAFADSTLFSNFCTFQPGKAELFVGMLEWLNHTSRLDDPVAKRALTIPLALVSVGLLALSIWLLRQWRGGSLVLVAAGVAAWTAGGWLVVQIHQQAMPLPPRHHAIQQVVIDRTLSSVPLFTGAFADDAEGAGYGLLEQWIPRIGNYISRRSGEEAFQGDGLVVICPTRLPSQSYRDALVAWVQAGGRLVVIDTPDLENSTANSVLMLFGLTSSRNAPVPDTKDAPLRLADGTAETPLLASCAIVGGEPVAWWGETSVAARIEFGRGTVTAIGFGSLFNDAAMGFHWLAEPDAEMRQRYEVLYGLLRAGLPHR